MPAHSVEAQTDEARREGLDGHIWHLQRLLFAVREADGKNMPRIKVELRLGSFGDNAPSHFGRIVCPKRVVKPSVNPAAWCGGNAIADAAYLLHMRHLKPRRMRDSLLWEVAN